MLLGNSSGNQVLPSGLLLIIPDLKVAHATLYLPSYLQPSRPSTCMGERAVKLTQTARVACGCSVDRIRKQSRRCARTIRTARLNLDCARVGDPSRTVPKAQPYGGTLMRMHGVRSGVLRRSAVGSTLTGGHVYHPCERLCVDSADNRLNRSRGRRAPRD